MTLKVVLAIVLIANGFFINYMASHGKLKSKSVQRIGYLTLFVGAGLLVPFDWWEYVYLPWWSGVAGGFVCALAMMLAASVVHGMRMHRAPERRRRYR